MKINNLKHIFFDLDHTLWDFDKNSTLTFDKIFKLHNDNVDIKSFLNVYWRLYRNEEIEKENLRYGRLKDSFDELSFKIDDELIYLLSEEYIVHLTTFNHLFEGTIEILEYLQSKYELHIITNGFDEAQYKKMRSSQITHYFKTVTNAELAGVKKPNPIIFDYALKAAKAKPNESIMIGDSLEADVLGALNVGYDAIFFNYRNDEVEPHIKQVKELSQLKMYL